MSAATMDEGRLTTVIVPRKWVDAAGTPDGDYHMSAAIVDYVNDVQQAGVFARHEMPAKAMQAYHADYYLAQVNNGGHSQFIGNSGELLRTITADALAGLEAMGAKAQHQILIEMAAWAATNPADAGAQDGFSIRAEPLDGLDKRFYAAEAETPIAPLAARWIAGWPELSIVEDDGYASAIGEIAAANPFLAPRLVWKNVQEIRYQLTDPLQIAVAAACGAAEPQPEIKTGVGGGFYQEIEGEQCLAFVVATQNGERLCVPDDSGGARLYECIQQSPLPEFGPGTNAGDIANYKPPLAGARLSAVAADTIQRFVDTANEAQVPEAIDLMLRKAGLGPEAMITACLATDGAPLWIVITEQSLTVARCFPNGAQLRDHQGNPVASVTKAEIEAHAAETAAAGATMRAPA
jgi:hypothetical protein